MNIERLLFISVLAAFSFVSCSKNEHQAAEFESVIREYYHDKVVSSCTFTILSFPTLYGKPEFREFHDQQICEGKVVINNARRIEPDRAETEIRFVFQANQQILRNLIKAWDALKERYHTLKPESVPNWRGESLHLYVDPSDGEVFVAGHDKPGDIFETPQWQQLEELRAFFTSKLNEREWETDIFAVTLMRENGQWKITNDGLSEEHVTHGMRK